MHAQLPVLILNFCRLPNTATRLRANWRTVSHSSSSPSIMTGLTDIGRFSAAAGTIPGTLAACFADVLKSAAGGGGGDGGLPSHGSSWAAIAP